MLQGRKVRARRAPRRPHQSHEPLAPVSARRMVRRSGDGCAARGELGPGNLQGGLFLGCCLEDLVGQYRTAAEVCGAAGLAGCEASAVCPPCNDSTSGVKEENVAGVACLRDSQVVHGKDCGVKDKCDGCGEQRVVRHGRRRTVSPPFTQEGEKEHEESEKQPVHNLLATIRAKVQQTKGSPRAQAAGLCEVQEDPTRKVGHRHSWKKPV